MRVFCCLAIFILCVSTHHASAATRPAGSCRAMRSDLPNAHGVVVRLLTKTQSATVTTRLRDQTGWIVDPIYASNSSVIVRIDETFPLQFQRTIQGYPLQRAMVPKGMDVALGQHVVVNWAHAEPGRNCIRVPNFIIVPTISSVGNHGTIS